MERFVQEANRAADDQGPYKGFLVIKCEECGEVKGFCIKRETYGYKCNCGHETPLERLRPLHLHCKCGQYFHYRTNLTEEKTVFPCLECGEPVELELNTRRTAYVTVGVRR